MKIVEFAEPINNDLPFDVVDDVAVYMRNDPVFYRKHFFPTFSKIADMHRSGKKIDKVKCLSDMVEMALENYCKKFDLADMPDEIFNNNDREQIIDRIFSEEMEQIQQGEYK